MVVAFTEGDPSAYMWHNQGEWVTCRQYSILIFQFKSLVHFPCYILMQTPSQSDIWLQKCDQFFAVQNNVKHKNLLSILACNSKSIFLTFYSHHHDHVTYVHYYYTVTSEISILSHNAFLQFHFVCMGMCVEATHMSKKQKWGLSTIAKYITVIMQCRFQGGGQNHKLTSFQSHNAANQRYFVYLGL